MEIISNNMFFGIFISLIAFEIGLFIYKKTIDKPGKQRYNKRKAEDSCACCFFG